MRNKCVRLPRLGYALRITHYAVVLIEPLVVRIKRRHRDVDDLQLPDGPVAAAGLDVDGGHRPHRDALAVELEVAFALEDEVDLGHPLVVVRAGVGADLDEVDRGTGAG